MTMRRVMALAVLVALVWARPGFAQSQAINGTIEGTVTDGQGGVPTEEGMERYIRMGVRFVLSGADFSFMMTGATARATALRRLE